MDAAIAALVGAALGAAGSFGATWLAQRKQGRRDILKLAADIAVRDYEKRMEIIRRMGGGTMPPIAVFIAYQVDFLTQLEKGDLSLDAIEKLRKRHRAYELAFEGKPQPSE